jgi:hypothetical protein
MSKRRLTLVTVLMVISAISACSSATSTTAPAQTVQASSASTANAVPAPMPLPSGEEGMVCADLGALVIAGNSSDPISTVADAMRLTLGQVIYAINNSCPDLKKLESDIGQ